MDTEIKEGDRVFSTTTSRIRPTARIMGTVVKVDTQEELFSVKWDRPCFNPISYPLYFFGKKIVLEECVFKDKDNPNVAFKRKEKLSEM